MIMNEPELGEIYLDRSNQLQFVVYGGVLYARSWSFNRNPGPWRPYSITLEAVEAFLALHHNTPQTQTSPKEHTKYRTIRNCLMGEEQDLSSTGQNLAQIRERLERAERDLESMEEQRQHERLHILLELQKLTAGYGEQVT